MFKSIHLRVEQSMVELGGHRSLVLSYIQVLTVQSKNILSNKERLKLHIQNPLLILLDCVKSCQDSKFK